MKILISLLLLPFYIFSYHQFSSQFHNPNSIEIINYVKQFLPINPIILECGAWNGEDTLKFIQAWPSGKIYSFEPIPEHFKTLSDKFQHLSNIKLFQLALADKNGEMNFYVSDFHNNGYPGASSSLLPPKEHLKFDHYVTFNKKINVKTITLDDWVKSENLSQIDFMWLDMQGYELNMLKNSEMLKNTKLIYMEVEFVEAYENQYLYPEIKNFMEDKGFILMAIDFDEKIALEADKYIKPGNSYPYYGNALFLNKNFIKNIKMDK